MQWKQHQAVLNMSLYPSNNQQQPPAPSRNEFVMHNFSISGSNNMFNNNNNNNNNFEDRQGQLLYDEYLKQENNQRPVKRIKNDEYCVVLGNMVYSDGISFNIVDSSYFAAYNQFLYEYIKIYDHLPPVPSRKIMSGGLKDHIFSNQQNTIQKVRYFYVFCFYVSFLCLVFFSI